jgi:hypothetical protein
MFIIIYGTLDVFCRLAHDVEGLAQLQPEQQYDLQLGFREQLPRPDSHPDLTGKVIRLTVRDNFVKIQPSSCSILDERFVLT